MAYDEVSAASTSNTKPAATSIWTKVTQAGDVVWEKDELLDVLYWWRQLIGLILGFVWGVIPMGGWISFVCYLGIAVAFTVMFYRSYLRIDEEEFGGFSELIQEGFGPSTALFMLTWVCTFSSIYF